MTADEYVELDAEESTPLHNALWERRLAGVIEELAASGEKFSLQHFLVERRNGVIPLQIAARTGQLDLVVKTLKDSGETPHLEHFLLADKDGWNSVHRAAMKGHFDQVARALQASGERLSLEHFLIKDRQGWTPLHMAAGTGQLDRAMQTLEASGEKLSAAHFLLKTDAGETVLSKAAEYDNLNQIFVPAYWAGRLGEMIKLWEALPETGKKRVNIDKAIALTIQLIIDAVPKIDLAALRHATRAAAPPSAAQDGVRAAGAVALPC